MAHLWSTTLAWRPFLEPIDVHTFWPLLLVPLIYAIALVHKTLKLPRLKHPYTEAARLGFYILSLMVTGAAVLWVVIEIV